MFFHYYTASDDSNSEEEEEVEEKEKEEEEEEEKEEKEEEEEEEGLQPLQDSILHHVERNWVPEINFDSSVTVPSTSTIYEQNQYCPTDSSERDPVRE